MAQLAVVLLALFGQMERTYTLERAAHARSVATAKGRRVGRPVTVTPDQLAYAAHLRDSGHTVADIIAKSGIPRTSLYRHLPPRPAEQFTVAPASPDGDRPAADAPQVAAAPTAVHPDQDGLLESVDWPDDYRPPCPVCTRPTSGLREQWARRAGVREPVVVARAWPCGCPVDEHAAALQAGAGPVPRAAGIGT